MKKLIFITIAAVLLLAGCTNGETKPAETPDDQKTAAPVQTETPSDDNAQNGEAQGELEEGRRVIELKPGYGKQDITVYRGNTVQFVFSDDGHVSINLPQFETEAEGEDSVSVTVKAKEVGEYTITTCTGDVCEMGSFKVVEYQEAGRYYKASPEEFEAQMDGNYVLLDVRTQEEYDAGAIEGATLIPLSELSARVGEIKQYDKVLVYCRSGNRSVAASEILLDAGFAEVHDLQGGIGAWQAYKGQ